MFSSFKIQERRFVILVVSLGLCLGCDQFLKEKAPAPPPFELTMEGSKCLEDLLPTINGYFLKTLRENQIHETVQCLDRSIQEFLNSTTATDRDSYRSWEIHRFFQNYVFKKEMAPELVREVMKLKFALLGGSQDVVTRAELSQLRQLLGVVEQELVRLYPDLDLLLARDMTPHLDEPFLQRLELAIRHLKSAAQNWMIHFNLGDSRYWLPDMSLLLGEIDRFSGLVDPNHPYLQWRRNIPTLEKIKSLLFGSLTEVRSARQNAEIWDLLIDLYRLKLHYHLRLPLLSWNTPEHFAELDAWIEQLFLTWERSYDLQKNAEIPFVRIDALLDDLRDRQFWIEPLQPETAKLTLRLFVDRFLSPSHVPESLGVNLSHVRRLHQEYRGYKMIQQILLEVFAGRSARPVTEVLVVLEKYPIHKKIQSLAPYSLREQNELQRGWQEFISLVNSPVRRHWEARGVGSIGLEKWDSWTYRDLSFLNLFRVPSSLLMRTYGLSTPRSTTLSGEQLAKVFDEFRSFGYEMGLFDLRSSDSAQRSVREADLFMPSGNGDGVLQFSELVELFSTLWGAGTVGVNNYKHWATAEGCAQRELDYFRKPYFNEACAARTFQAHFSDLFSELPFFVKFQKSLSQARWDQFYQGVFTMSRVCPNDTRGLETGDQRTMVVILNYIENLFAVYDRDRNQKLDEYEVAQAYPRFERFMVEVIKKKVEASGALKHRLLETIGYNWSKMAEEAFKYIVFKGHSPSNLELLGFMAKDWLHVRGELGGADRQDILEVFVTLKKEMPSSEFDCHVQ